MRYTTGEGSLSALEMSTPIPSMVFCPPVLINFMIIRISYHTPRSPLITESRRLQEGEMTPIFGPRLHRKIQPLERSKSGVNLVRALKNRFLGQGEKSRI